MAYRRRRFSGRRRYSRRRRPSVSRAVLPRRLTMAPRHQYLKLKRQVVFIDSTNLSVGALSPVTSGGFAFALQLPGSQLADGTANSWLRFSRYTSIFDPSTEALGWTAYGSLFSKYVVAGVKIKITCSSVPYNQAASTWNLENFTGATTFSAYNLGDALSPTTYQDVVASPLGRVHGVLGRSKPLVIKRYISLNSLFGEIVKKHDSYVHQWTATPATDPTTLAGHFRLRWLQGGVSTGPGVTMDALPTCTAEIVYYIHALWTNTKAVSPEAFAQLKNLSVAGGHLGEPLEFDAADKRAAQEGELPRTSAGFRHQQSIQEI